MPKLHVSVDWLSFNCMANNYTLIADCMPFKVVKQSYSTPQFSNVYLIYIDGEEISTITSQPQSSIINKDLIQVKLNNKLLYSLDLIAVIQNMCTAFNMSFTSISRIDLCHDLNQFNNGYSLTDFATALMRKEVIKKQRSDLTLNTNTSLNAEFHYLRFGKKSSDICFYIYDKTKEMEEKKLKPWIIDTWKLQGIDTSKQVYRFEFSIKNTRYGLTDTTTGETFNLSDINILTSNNIANLFSCCFSKYADFRLFDGKSRVDRMQKVDLLSFNNSVHILTELSSCSASDKFKKYTIKQLLTNYHYLRIHKAETIRSLLNAAYTYAEVHDLKLYTDMQSKLIECEQINLQIKENTNPV